MAKGKSIESQIKRFNKHPDARLAWKLHEHFRSKGQLGKAMNWAERALASPRLTSSIPPPAPHHRPTPPLLLPKILRVKTLP